VAPTLNTVVHATLEQQAEAALRSADDEPRRALASAREVHERALAAGDHRAASAALRAQGLAQLHLREVDHAIATLTLAVEEGGRAGARDVEGRARMTLAAALSQSSRLDDALREAELAVAGLEGLDQARARAQRGLVQTYLRDLEGALRSFAEAESVLRLERDDEHLLSALLNRGALLFQYSDLSGAAEDYLEAVALAQAMGRELQAGYAHANLGLVCTVRGEVLEALDHLTAAETAIRTHGGTLGQLLTLRGELLLSVRLLAEARRCAAAALRIAVRSHDSLSAADTRLLLAQIAMADGHPPEAQRLAGRAAKAFTAHGQQGFAAFARLQELRAAVARGAARRLPPLEEVEALVETVSAAGWAWSRVEARIAAAEVALRRSTSSSGRGLDRGRAVEHLAAAAHFRDHGPATVRARAWYGEARRRELLGDGRGAGRAASAGLRVLDDYAQALGATDLRAHAAGHRTDLAEIGLRTAFATGDPRSILVWAERGRASHLQRPRIRPPADPVLSGLLTQLRAAAAEVDELDRAGQPSGAAVRRQVALEGRIRDHVRLEAPRTRSTPWRATGNGAAATATSATSTATVRMATRMATRTATRSAQALAAAVDGVLDGRALVEYVVLDGHVHAVTVVTGRARLHKLGTLDEVTGLLPRISFAMQRLVRRRPDPRSAEAGSALLTDTGRRLDTLLLAPLREADGRDLVLVPTGPLQAVAWSLLPSVAERAITVVPAAALWVTAMSRDYATGHVAVAAGPGLPGADEEARTVATMHGVEPLTGAQATVAGTSQLMSGSALAHLATHGRLSHDNPLFSSLTMADGPLFVHDLERVATLPHTVVLAACDSGRNAVLAGDELLGLSGAFLAGGTAQLVASVIPVPDHETGTLMAALHREILAGALPAAALRTVQRELAEQSPAAFAAAAGFVCLGAGYLPPPLPSWTRPAPVGAGLVSVPAPRQEPDAGRPGRQPLN
jgi:tetratricopeptide (TPR) repeat protein